MTSRRVIRPLHAPRRIRIQTGVDGRPTHVEGCLIETIREEWRVEEGWWSDPIRRQYFELVLIDGRLLIVFQDAAAPGSWYRQ